MRGNPAAQAASPDDDVLWSDLAFPCEVVPSDCGVFVTVGFRRCAGALAVTAVVEQENVVASFVEEADSVQASTNIARIAVTEQNRFCGVYSRFCGVRRFAAGGYIPSVDLVGLTDLLTT